MPPGNDLRMVIDEPLGGMSSRVKLSQVVRLPVAGSVDWTKYNSLYSSRSATTRSVLGPGIELLTFMEPLACSSPL